MREGVHLLRHEAPCDIHIIFDASFAAAREMVNLATKSGKKAQSASGLPRDNDAVAEDEYLGRIQA